jgi:cytochrome c553
MSVLWIKSFVDRSNSRGMEARVMRIIEFRSTMLALVFSAAFSWAGHAESLATRNCTWCHGGSAQGYGAAPRLAGQKRQYIEYQLLSFRRHIRDNPDSKQYMWAAAENLSAQRVHYLASYFSSHSAVAANNGNREMAASGKEIYQNGIPNSNVVACIACHGPNAEGMGEIPRLGGLAYDYLKRRLQQWAEGYNANARLPMPGVASKLSSNEIEALASYLSFIQ